MILEGVQPAKHQRGSLNKPNEALIWLSHWLQVLKASVHVKSDMGLKQNEKIIISI